MKVIHHSKEKTKDHAEAAGDQIYQVLKKLPKPDFHHKMDAAAKYWYNEFGQILVATGMFTNADVDLLVDLAKAKALKVQAEDRMNKRGYDGGVIQTFSTGAQQISPHMVVVKMQNSIIKDIREQFGFGFKNRSKITGQESGDPNQTNFLAEFDKMLNG